MECQWPAGGKGTSCEECKKSKQGYRIEEEDEEEEEAEDDERERKRRKTEGARLRVRVIWRERLEEEEDEEEGEVAQEPFEQMLEWLQHHMDIVVRLLDRADFCQRELYNVQVSINNNLVLLNRNVERWMRRGEGVDVGVGTEQEVEREEMQEELEETEVMMDEDVNTE